MRKGKVMRTGTLMDNIEVMLKGGYRPDEIALTIEGVKKYWGLNEFDVEDLEQMIIAIKHARGL